MSLFCLYGVLVQILYYFVVVPTHTYIHIMDKIAWELFSEQRLSRLYFSRMFNDIYEMLYYMDEAIHIWIYNI